jgi:hypothetical protein
VNLPTAGVDVRDGLGLVDRRLRRLELFARGDHGARLVEPLSKFVRARIRDRLGRRAAEETGRDRARRGGRSSRENGDPALHEADATLPRSSCLVLHRTFPNGAPDEAARPKEGG